MDLKKLKDMPPWDWPEDTDEVLLSVLRNDRAGKADRLLAAELAGDFTVINDVLVEALLSILRNNDAAENLRETAALSLGPVLDHADTDGFDDSLDVPISEDTFRVIQKSLHRLYMDADVPKNVRRKILEASVRAPEEWHSHAIHAAYAGDDADWKLTAVFAMRWVPGFDDQILEMLESKDRKLHCHAVYAAGNWEIDAAWPHISGLISSSRTGKGLLLAAIEAAVNIRPEEAEPMLSDLAEESDDVDVIQAALEAMADACDFDDFDDDDNIEHLF